MNKLEVKNLNVGFSAHGDSWTNVVSDLSYEVPAGSIFALVGESGCGKSVSTLALTRLFNARVRIQASAITFYPADCPAIDLLNASEKTLRKVRGGEIAYIFQDPATSLNPVFRVGDQIAEAVKLHRPEVGNVRTEVVKLLNDVGIPDPEKRIGSYPHELSGGMQQRIMIAMALAGNPELLIADEPTTALDVTIQSQILELLDSLRRERQMTVILITHNLGIVAELADYVAVMYAGELVEYAAKEELMNSPMHPYTKALLRAVPSLEHDAGRLFSIEGAVPGPKDYPPYCRFFARCRDGNDDCRRGPASYFRTATNHICKCTLPQGEKR